MVGAVRFGMVSGGSRVGWVLCPLSAKQDARRWAFTRAGERHRADPREREKEHDVQGLVIQQRCFWVRLAGRGAHRWPCGCARMKVAVGTSSWEEN